MIIALANGFLIGRILWQKRHWQRAGHRQRKLTIQLSSVAALYIIFWSPLTINGLICTFTSSSTSLELQGEYFLFLPYMVVMFLPLVSLPLLPDFKKALVKKRQPTVEPWNTMVNGPTITVKPLLH
jgi:hypothetical protein